MDLLGDLILNLLGIVLGSILGANRVFLMCCLIELKSFLFYVSECSCNKVSFLLNRWYMYSFFVAGKYPF